MPDEQWAENIILSLFSGLTDTEIERIAERMRVVRDHGHGALTLQVQNGMVIYSEIKLGDKIGERGRIRDLKSD